MLDLIWLHSVAYQVIVQLNNTQPCFLNMTAGADMWKNCGMDQDYLKAALMPWMWVTGGWFTTILAAVFIIMTWLKYQKVIYPIMIGIAFLPLTYALFPSAFLNYALIMVGITVGLLLYNAFISQTNES